MLMHLYKSYKNINYISTQVIAERKFYHEKTNGRYLQSFGDNTSAVSDDTSAETREST